MRFIKIFSIKFFVFLSSLLWLAGAVEAVENCTPGKLFAEKTFKQVVRDSRYALNNRPESSCKQMNLAMAMLFEAGQKNTHQLRRFGIEGSFLLNSMSASHKENFSYSRINYDKFKKMLQTLRRDIENARTQFEKLTTRDFTYFLDLSTVQFDANADGKKEQQNNLSRLIFNSDKSIPVKFDRGDINWFIAYTSVFAGFLDFVLAYDMRELFERAGHVIFPYIESPYVFLQSKERYTGYYDYNFIMDVLAAVHSVRFKCVNKAKLQSSLENFLYAVKISRESWQFYEAETDDSYEWIPYPGQKKSATGIRITAEQQKEWVKVLAEIEDVLRGKKNLPFWRNMPGYGFNLNRFLNSGSDFDLVYMMQGTDAYPFLDNIKPVSSKQTWSRFNMIFRGRLWFYALWLN